MGIKNRDLPEGHQAYLRDLRDHPGFKVYLRELVDTQEDLQRQLVRCTEYPEMCRLQGRITELSAAIHMVDTYFNKRV